VLIELVESMAGMRSLLKLIAPDVLPVFEMLVKSRKTFVLQTLRVMRSFSGMILSYFLTGMLISGSVIDKLMPKILRYLRGIMLHGILKSEA